MCYLLFYSYILILPTTILMVRNNFAYEYSKLDRNLYLSQVAYKYVPNNAVMRLVPYSHSPQYPTVSYTMFESFFYT